MNFSGNYFSKEESGEIFENSVFKKFRLRGIFKQKADEKQLAFIAENLAQMYKAGIPIAMAVELVIDILSNRVYKNSLYNILIHIKEGKSLSQGFGQYKELYPYLFVGMVAIGENTGKLYQVLRGLSEFYSKLMFIKTEIKNACIYPIFVLISLVALSIFFVNTVIPNFCEIYKSMNVKLPAACQILYDINNNMRDDPLITGTTIVCWMSVILIILKECSKKVSIDKFSRIPIVKGFFEYMMVLLFSIITSTGINISHALEYCEGSINSAYLRKKTGEINLNILKGKTLTESLMLSGIFSKHTLAIIKIREESGTIEQGFKELSQDLEYKLSEQIKKYLKCINPAFMLIMAGFIVVFLLVFVLPLFNNLQNGIR
ncbi:Type II secretion system F domain containing protein [Clostridium sp. DL-VIII]|uniref:type II secretion system F family protein n=1 Tax=Clostridium sp. DL-VIII TaxID=641107 RepID=UPI00023AFF2B|nr:type II secretion system F family protein [Clostridium sp. DL-VIII]EHI99723.1 Type II secretion system F domain containing protein [Clostridium sp. DL-VIII]